MKYEDYSLHPLANEFPLMRGAAFDDFAVSIEQRGLLEPIVMLDGVVIDGRNRLRACLQSGVTPRFTNYEYSIPVEEFIWTVNVDRRHLTDDQKAAASMAWEEFEREQSLARQAAEFKIGNSSRSAPVDADREASTPRRSTRGALMQRAQVSYRKINDAIKIKRHDEAHGTDYLKQVESGAKKLAEAKQEAGIVAKPKQIKKLREKRFDEIRELAARGYRTEQIADQLGITARRVQELASKANIELAGKKTRTLDVNRIVEQTVSGAQSLTFGVEELALDNLDQLDASRVDEWVESLAASISVLSRLLRQMKKGGIS